MLVEISGVVRMEDGRSAPRAEQSSSGNGRFAVAPPTISLPSDESDVFTLAGVEDLVPELDDRGEIADRRVQGYRVRRCRPRIEGPFARIERWSRPGDTHRRSISRENATTIYGKTEDSRISAGFLRRTIWQGSANGSKAGPTGSWRRPLALPMNVADDDHSWDTVGSPVCRPEGVKGYCVRVHWRGGPMAKTRRFRRDGRLRRASGMLRSFVARLQTAVRSLRGTPPFKDTWCI